MKNNLIYKLQVSTGLLSLLVFIATCANNPTELQLKNSRSSYYVNSLSGDDSKDGLSPETAWKTLVKVSERTYRSGDKILLKSGSTFRGKLVLQNSKGDSETPIIIDSYGDQDGSNKIPLIDAAGYVAGIHILNSSYLEISNIEITSDGNALEEAAMEQRFGVLVTGSTAGNFRHIQIKNLIIHDIFAANSVPSGGKNAKSNMGMGIAILAESSDANFSDILIEGCTISRTGYTGIKTKGKSSAYIQTINVLNNELTNIGGPGIQPGYCRDMIVRGNTVSYSGSDVDPRMHGRGSGIWPWSCENVLIEKNRFMHARGKADSCGMHIDYNCKNVVVQYNFSMDNEGGFIEILGNNYNCSYRYNISVNDGFRVKGVDGAHQEGKILWTSGYVGTKNEKHGPYNTYIYNNTIYTDAGTRSTFSVMGTSKGILIANNIFHVQGNTYNVSGDQDSRGGAVIVDTSRVIFRNNLYASESVIPGNFPIQDSNPRYGDPVFNNPGGQVAENYLPRQASLIKDMGIPIPIIPGDNVGLEMGLEVEQDYAGNPIVGQPDLGAFEIQ